MPQVKLPPRILSVISEVQQDHKRAEHVSGKRRQGAQLLLPLLLQQVGEGETNKLPQVYEVSFLLFLFICALVSLKERTVAEIISLSNSVK